MFIDISIQKFDSSVLPGMYLQCFIVSAQSFFEMFLALHCLTGTAFLSTYGKITLGGAIMTENTTLDGPTYYTPIGINSYNGYTNQLGVRRVRSNGGSFVKWRQLCHWERGRCNHIHWR